MRRALIFGCSQYANEPYKNQPLPNSLQDVLEFERLIKEQWGFRDKEIRFRQGSNILMENEKGEVTGVKTTR